MLMPTNRRQFLKNACMTGISLSLATGLRPATVVQLCPYDINWLIRENSQLQELVQQGTAPLWVAGQTLNSFAYHLRFINLEPELASYLRRAGGEWKGHLQAKGLWETIPPQIRAGGQSEILRFLDGKDWSHRIPRSQGGSTTADNGIFELRLLNRMRGAKTMTSGEIAEAKAVIRSDVVLSVVRQTLGAMVKGAMIGVIISGLISCLEYGLDYAEGKITWEQMVTEIIKRILFAGGLSFVITGLLVGLGLLFPGLIPALVVPMFVIRIVGLVFLAQSAVSLGKRYWGLLEKHDLILVACQILRETEENMRETVRDFEQSISEKILEWLRSIAMRILGKRAASVNRGFYETLEGVRFRVWIATQTHLVSGYASDTVSPLRVQGYAYDRHDILRFFDIPDVNLPEIAFSMEEMKELIAYIINCAFKEAIRTACILREYLRICLESGGLHPTLPPTIKCLGPLILK